MERLHKEENLQMEIYKVLAKVYDLLDVIYFRDTPKNPRKKIYALIPNKSVKVLDLCCGTMGNTINIAKQKDQISVTGLDCSKEMLQMAENKIKKLKLKNAETVIGDATDTKFPDASFDFIIIGLVLHETPEKLNKKILKEAHRILKPNGKLIVLEWELPKKPLQKILFLPIRFLEPKPFKKFVRYNKIKYFEHHKFKVEKLYHTDYSCVVQMNNF